MTTTPPSPPKRNPNLTLRPATRSDLPSLASTIAASFLDFELYDHFLPHRRLQYQEFYRFLLLRLRGLYAEAEARFIIAEGDPDVLMPLMDRERVHSDGSVPTVPAVSSTGRVVVGFAVWEAMGEGSELMREWTGEGYDASAGGRGWGSFASAVAAYAETHLVEWERLYVKYFLNTICDHRVLSHLRAVLGDNFEGLTAMLHLQFLITHPSFQRTGAGSLLLDWGLNIAREKAIPVVLESSLVGWKFYERRGFKAFKMMRVEAGTKQREMGTQSYDMPVMIWEPEGHEGEWTERDGEGGWKLRTGVGEIHVERNEGFVEV